MGFLKRLLGIAENEKHESITHDVGETEKKVSFKERLENWEPPVIRPPSFIGKYERITRYTYKDIALIDIPNNLVIDFEMVGKEVELEYDEKREGNAKAIKVMCDEINIGYIPNNNLQDMIHDFRKRGEPIYAIISNIEFNEETEIVNKVYIFIAFYRDVYKDIDKYGQIKTRLIKTSKKDLFDINRQDNIEVSNIGDEVRLEFDYDTNSYLVTCSGDEIGETNKTITCKLQEANDNCDFIGKIEEINQNDEERYSVVVTIYLKPL